MENVFSERYCSHQVSRLLREKGFNCPCRAFYKTYEGKTALCRCTRSTLFDYCNNETLARDYSDENEVNIATPTQSMAVDYVMVKYGLIILCDFVPKKGFCFNVKTDESSDDGCVVYSGCDITHFQTLHEAKDAGLEYVLENLI